MKRRALEKQLRRAGCYLKRDRTGVVEAVPRHNEVKEPLAKSILRNLGAA
jgi:mRNA interferase HicA